MQKTVRGSIPAIVAFLALLAPAVLAGGGWWDDLLDDHPVALEKILKSPEAFRGQTVSFVLQFHQLGRIDNPFYTKFQSDWFLNFSAWSETAPLWEKDAYKRDFAYLFIRRNSAGANEMLNAPIYSRWVVTAEVSEVFKGTPWIEITGLTRIETQLDEPALVHLVKGLMLRDLRRFDAAAQEFHAVDHKGLPEVIRVMAMREEGLALHACGKTPLGIARLETALEVIEDDPMTRQALVSLRASIGLDPDGHPLPEPPAVEPPPSGGN